ncbi:MAG: 4Fe-4S dicluster domain-containing protein [Planctomycetes bacterium]|nr:4Fe-4S dicluster domain-containing protein [Planctomycetota bacterium]
MSEWAILTDTTLCSGCEKCVEACKRENKLGKDEPRRWKKRIDDLSSTRHTTILRRPGDHYVRAQCRHCVEPACASACLVGALRKTPEGPVVYDREKCMGCRYCMVACPYGIPRYDWENPAPYIRKCGMCYDRLKQGGLPACVEACPEKATIFGERGDLIQKAHDRIRDNPGKYVDKVYGEFEVGGTSVLYISDIPLDFLSFERELDDRRLPDLTWAALSKVPPLVLGMGGLMTGVWWIVGRRMKLAQEATQSATTSETTDREPWLPSEKDEEK